MTKRALKAQRAPLEVAADHLGLGVKRGKPARCGSPDDILECVIRDVQPYILLNHLVTETAATQSARHRMCLSQTCVLSLGLLLLRPASPASSVNAVPCCDAMVMRPSWVLQGQQQRAACAQHGQPQACARQGCAKLQQYQQQAAVARWQP